MDIARSAAQPSSPPSSTTGWQSRRLSKCIRGRVDEAIRSRPDAPFSKKAAARKLHVARRRIVNFAGAAYEPHAFDRMATSNKTLR